MRVLAPAIPTVLLAASMLPAHGGQYRGRMPTVDGRDIMPAPGSWQQWWETQREPLLRQATAPVGPITTSGSSEPGARRGAEAPSPLVVTDADCRDRIAPVLLALLAEERSRDVRTACLVALAKMGVDGPKAPLESALTPWLTNDDLEVRETAALALGWIADRDAMPWNLPFAADANYAVEVDTLSNGFSGILDIL